MENHKTGFNIICLLFIGLNLSFAQENRSELALNAANQIDNLLQGRLYKQVYQGVSGSQYLEKNWQLGEVQLINQTYSGLPLWYDIFADELVFLYDQGSQGLLVIQLIKSYIRSFEFESRLFIHSTFSSFQTLGLKPGFYEQVFADKLTYLVKRSKELQNVESISTFIRKDARFLIYKNEFYKLKNKKSLLSILGDDQKKQLKAFLRGQPFVLRAGDDNGWLETVQFLNQLESN